MSTWRTARRVMAAVLAVAGAAVSSCSPARGARHHRLDVQDLAFLPPTIQIAPGDTVSWVNRGIVPHTVTAVEAGWDSGELAPEGTFTLVAAGDGTIRYGCRFHPTMTGELRLPR